MRGSNLHAQESIDIAAAEIDIRAGVSSNASQEDVRHIESGYTWDLLGDGSSLEDKELGGNYNVGNGGSQSEGLQFNNTQINAGAVRLDSDGLLSVRGANVSASESLVIEAGDLEVSSVQNTDSSSTRSFGGSWSGAGGGVNASDGDSERLATIVTSLTGDQVEIRVNNHSEVRGAVIAAIDENGKDNGQLTFSTDTLNAALLVNTGESTDRSTSVQGGETSTLNYQDDAEYDRTKSLATIGSGNITISDSEGSDTRFLNSDIDNTEVSIYELESIRGLSGELDTRLLTEDGRYQIAEDWPKTRIIVNTIEQIVSTERVGIEDFFNETDRYHTAYEAVKEQIGRDPALAAMLQDPALAPEQKEAMLDQLAGAVAEALEFRGPNNTIVATDEPTSNGSQFYGFYSSWKPDRSTSMIPTATAPAI